LVRLLVGLAVFFPEGLQKLLFPALLGSAGACPSPAAPQRRRRPALRVARPPRRVPRT